MDTSTKISVFQLPEAVQESRDFLLEIRPQSSSSSATEEWLRVPAFSAQVAQANLGSNKFHEHAVTVASVDFSGPVQIRIKYIPKAIDIVHVLPRSYGIELEVDKKESTVVFTLGRPMDTMIRVNNDKWQALHLLTNHLDHLNSPSLQRDDEHIWYFGPGINNGAEFSKVVNGDLVVPSGTRVYLDQGAFVTARFCFLDTQDCILHGHGFIYNGPNGGAILVERSHNIQIENVTSIGATGFSLTVGQSSDVQIRGYRSFSSHGNGDGVDLFCCSNVLVEGCFLRNSDDTIAIYGHRWDYYGDTKDITIRNCVLLPDIAHPIQIGTHGNPEAPETMSNIRIENIDVLDHEENQTWYQGCISINVGDENLVRDVVVDGFRVERITKGQLFNFRVMKNAMWTTAPGRGIHDVTIKNMSLDVDVSGQVNPSQILGYDQTRNISNIRFENLKVGNVVVHDNMAKPRWYMVSDFVPAFVNEHVSKVEFKLT